ncbi:XdhC family protein [Luteibacter yeojuensis]|uniref:Xanthine dehydrogenase accessory factor n=1 Tax=Luteibacter yeojuensis TaxID=345309 RepID=A0A0F3KV53_9GAMM|nr:XdhC family protein [Luteibacter yeojuensis]KJV34847.1 hypothetical protein VI08_09755 [Luteibacter yeojuensis]
MKSHGELTDLAAAWRDVAAKGTPAALATILHTSGSTFRRVGAAMLVRADRSVVNPLAGGCPQQDIVDKSLSVMETGRVAYVAYNAEQGLDMLMDIGCGGELEVAIEPLDHRGPSFLDVLDHALGSSQPFRITTDFPPPGHVGGVTRAVHMLGAGATARDAAASEPHTDGTRLVETFDAPVSLVVAGASHEGRELATLAARLGWRGAIVDTSIDRLSQLGPTPPGWSAVETHPGRLAQAVRLHRATAMLAMTHDLALDIAWLEAGAAAGAFYLGALGSQQRARAIRHAVASTVLHVPAGLDIGSNTTREIALSIVAEIMAARHARDGRALSQTGGPIH